ncbi:hypothetical protein ASPSYDRAFT_30764 [Aspergillus sydowii CBS 593.65]|uniref:Uncharacterized protein n=1 Tax=Aspergillus sydowii CBS 593.65 TaxID=1036612 RepID=A0A1L9TKI5_9EURO|nr:uncharacterized protein ASPSYDRAFT_30764 [Aspergillus sydowii CBS 593.65]OJJ59946.1 hypothetical protein ASPSYDRAFT_30764 [Aspergillus sydowii CBS 593.65]
MSWECKTTIWLTVVSGKIRQLLRGPAKEWPPALASMLLPTASGVPDCSTQLLHPDNILMQFILDIPHSRIRFQIWVVDRGHIAGQIPHLQLSTSGSDATTVLESVLLRYHSLSFQKRSYDGQEPA